MKRLVALALLIPLASCGPKLTQEACIASDINSYKNVTFTAGHKAVETGLNGPNRAGVEAFNKKIVVSGFKNRRSSEFAFRTKTAVPKLNPTQDFTCKSQKLQCEDSAANHCQVFTCEGVIPADVEINLIDTPVNKFYKTTEPTRMEWDGQNLKCGPA